MPGIAESSAATTRRIEGTAEISRSTRSTRSARRIDRLPVVGNRAMPTTTKSKTFQGSRKKRQP
jgi:hypothetical protein